MNCSCCGESKDTSKCGIVPGYTYLCSRCNDLATKYFEAGQQSERTKSKVFQIGMCELCDEPIYNDQARHTATTHQDCPGVLSAHSSR